MELLEPGRGEPAPQLDPKAPDPAPGADGQPQAQTAPEHESPGETETAAQTTRPEAIRADGRKLFGKWNLRWGRRKAPKPAGPGLDGHEEPNLSASLLESAPSFVAPAPEPRDPLIIRRSIAAIGKAARKFGDKIVFRKALEASGNKDYAREVRDLTSATDDECDALGEVTDILLKELGLDTKYLPLAAALVVVAGAGTRYVVTIKDLNKQIRDKQPGQHKG